METATEPTMHIGRKISRIRELRGIKQETLAQELGVSQQSISKLEQSEHIDDERLEGIAKALGVSAEAIKHFDELTAINIISNTFSDFKDNSIANANYCTFNLLVKLVETVNRYTTVVEENKNLYERLLQSEKEKVTLLEQMLQSKR